MDTVGEVCPMCFDVFEDPVILSCGHKLCLKCVQTLTPIRIVGHENYVSVNSSYTIDSSKYGIKCPYRCSTSSLKEFRRTSFDYMMYSPEASLKIFIICFLIDGTDRYMEMTIRAINSLMISTPVVFVGILVPPLYDTSNLYSRLIDPTRVIFKEFRRHFNKWNPTQYKLDIAQFAQDFSIVFWLDSDTYVYKDLTPLLMDFRFSSAKFAFLPDHVCTNPEFLGNWKNKKDPFIPQACFMGFRREYITPFFTLWEELWRTWIEPRPFYNYDDPLPSFEASAFCTEQYALGMAIEKFGLSRNDIFELRRVCIPLGYEEHLVDGVPASTNTGRTKAAPPQAETAVMVMDLKQTFLEHIMTSYRPHSAERTLRPAGSSTTRAPSPLHSSYSSYSSYTSYSNSSYLSSYSSSPFSSHSKHFWVDDIEGHIIHFYSMFYEIAYTWFSNHKETIIRKIEEYWNPLTMSPLLL